MIDAHPVEHGLLAHAAAARVKHNTRHWSDNYYMIEDETKLDSDVYHEID